MALDKTKVVYQIYPKSYKDTTGNGIGDFRGIIEKNALSFRTRRGYGFGLILFIQAHNVTMVTTFQIIQR